MNLVCVEKYPSETFESRCETVEKTEAENSCLGIVAVCVVAVEGLKIRRLHSERETPGQMQLEEEE